ncbi:hypothetical protein B1222_20995 [Paenibacillus larvae subsp. pulvifaciens]|uniref:DUF2247 family protein n=1 Tax=Paenibacillus larvae TaxID=1464 RepID=UPI00098F7B16|nr:DUF2247 family protein [Paenibacillus larvae]AQT86324.1 hypothetical protein B1222_20995 [Paenibacillus larvae subsp. pulvifaciens]AQZ47976.1 hypothetical protein B5S25_16655 [Paenibacillus larvae subsp. pulvifaciens]MEC0185638.1 DUF2247 family protein [Paenibacillus larvae]
MRDRRGDNALYNLELFDKHKVEYNWGTLLEGLKLNLLNVREVGKYAERFISAKSQINNDILIELAWTKNSVEEVTNLIETLLKDIGFNYDIQVENRKWRYCIIKNLRQVEKDNKILLEKVAEIYSDFDYPEDMEDVIYYIEPKDDYNPKIQSKEENVNRLIKKLDAFLEKEKEFLNR